ncbi:hypothetical protein LINPERPRIM_LOCUS25289 [Linum perenne]
MQHLITEHLPTQVATTFIHQPHNSQWNQTQPYHILIP